MQWTRETHKHHLPGSKASAAIPRLALERAPGGDLRGPTDDVVKAGASSPDRPSSSQRNTTDKYRELPSM